MRGHDEGLPAHGAGMGLTPVLGVGGRRRGRLVEGGRRLAVGQEDDAAGMVDLFGAGNAAHHLS